MSESSSPRQQILLVDDEEDALIELAESLENEGFVCFTASSVTDALQELTLNPDIALIITDLRMPEESGISLIKRLREHTERARKAVEADAFEHGGDVVRLTISAGVCQATAESGLSSDITRKADVSLYSAKNNGRNRVEMFAA